MITVSSVKPPRFGQAYVVQNIDPDEFNKKVIHRIPGALGSRVNQLVETGIRNDLCAVFVGPEARVLLNINQHYGNHALRRAIDSLIQQPNIPVIDMQA